MKFSSTLAAAAGERRCTICASSSAASSQSGRSAAARRTAATAASSSPADAAAGAPVVAGAVGEIGEGLRREAVVAALQRERAEQELVEHRLVGLVRRRRNVRGLRKRAATRQRERENGNDQADKESHLGFDR